MAAQDPTTSDPSFLARRRAGPERRVWPESYLPRTVRAAWQDAHTVLPSIGAGPHIPQL